VSADPDLDTVSVEADGLALAISVATEAAALDGRLSTVIAGAIAAANQTVGPTPGAATVIVDNDECLRQLNKRWRGLDKPTNVLSFPAPDLMPGLVSHIGDIAISFETAAREAAAEGKSFADHIAHLSVHGFLHLLGYDHESDDDAEEMEGLERVILARIGISDPYLAHDTEG
jgi:probable rRNA maturation factor